MGSGVRSFSGTRHEEDGSRSCCFPGMSDLDILIDFYLFSFSPSFHMSLNFCMVCFFFCVRKMCSEMKKILPAKHAWSSC